MRYIRFGVLSTAKIARTQLIPAMFRAGNAEVVAIASRGSKVHEVAAALQIPKAYESYDDLLKDPDIDAVYIPLPNYLHKEWVCKAADHDKHILCEKPAALHEREAAEMIEYCKEKNVKFIEAFMYQLHPQHERVREIIASGEIGDVKLMKSSHSFYMKDRVTNIRMDKEMGGGSLYDMGCYSIHAACHILQTEPIRAHALAEMDPDTNVDVSTFAHLKMTNGVNVMFDCSFDMANRNEYEIIGTKGTIKVPYAFRPDKNEGGIGLIVVTCDGVSREERIPGDLYRLEVEHFSNYILEDGEPFNTAEETIRNMRAIDACYESIQTGQVINIKQ
ncbi:Gfo/Idh/MocA family protein [Jeotgalibacillus marinus]|uniref:Gfo/Idh/MocA family oxidoreductase n=1 Tax=Jeotgalibacillus marinus TaxID=86667 RepID=A0ABV3Q4G3_9BACL